MILINPQNTSSFYFSLL